jgi:hypothetical protein
MKLFDSVQQGDGKLNLSAIFSPSSSPACLSINSVARTKGGTMARSWPHKMSRWIGMTQDEAQHGALSTHPNEISKKRANIPRYVTVGFPCRKAMPNLGASIGIAFGESMVGVV